MKIDGKCTVCSDSAMFHTLKPGLSIDLFQHVCSSWNGGCVMYFCTSFIYVTPHDLTDLRSFRVRGSDTGEQHGASLHPGVEPCSAAVRV